MNTEGIRANAHDVIQGRASGVPRLLAVEPEAMLKLLDVVDAARRWHDDPTVRAHDALRIALAALSESEVSA